MAAGLTKKNGGGAKFVRRTDETTGQKKNYHRQNLQKRTGHNSHFEVSDMPQLLLPRCHYSSPAPSPIHLPIMHKHEVPLSFSAPQTIKYIFVFFSPFLLILRHVTSKEFRKEKFQKNVIRWVEYISAYIQPSPPPPLLFYLFLQIFLFPGKFSQQVLHPPK